MYKVLLSKDICLVHIKPISLNIRLQIFFCGWNRKFALKFFFFKISLSNGVVKMLKLYWEEAQIIHLNNSLLVNEHIHSLIILCHEKMRIKENFLLFQQPHEKMRNGSDWASYEKRFYNPGKDFLGAFGTKSDIFVWSKMIRL